MRRIDEFPELKKIFPSEEMLLRRLPATGGDAPELDRNEEVAWELLEEERTLGDLVSKTRVSRFSTYECLKQLLEKGLLEITREAAPAAPKPAVERPSSRRKPAKRRVLPTIAAVLILAGCVFAGDRLVPRPPGPGWTAVLRPVPSPVEERLGEAAIIAGLEEHAAVGGSYPVNLDVLSARGIVPAAVVRRTRAAGFRYRPVDGGESYELTRDPAARRP